MGRNAEIRIINQTGYILKNVSENTEHGKFNQKPPTEIPNGGTGIFKVGNRVGGTYGPKGTVTYSVAISSNNKSEEIKLVFFWNHPFSGADSAYTVSSVPPGLVNYSLDPSMPKGHDQVLSITVSLQGIQNAYDIKSWMKSLNDNMPLGSITMPGTHDSGALKGGIAYECQSMSIDEQISKGIRFLDIRLKINDDTLKIFHRDKNMGISFNDVINDCRKFLMQNSSECIIMSVKNEGDNPIDQKVNDVLTADEKLWWLKDSIPNLGEARGKIVLFRRYAASDPNIRGINVSDWKDDSDQFWLHNNEICVQDKYTVYDTSESIKGKWHNIEKLMDLANVEPGPKMYINFTSGAGGISPVMLATGKGIITGEGINEKLYKKLAPGGKGKYGIIVMDYPESPTEMLIPYIINKNNF